MFFVRDFEVCVSLLGYSWRAGVEARMLGGFYMVLKVPAR